MNESEHVRRNREAWDETATEYVEQGERAWASDEPRWGVFGVPESDVGVLDERYDGRDAVELGCGTGYVSAWLARRGARAVGIDNSTRQLETARRLQGKHGLEFPLVHGDAEHLPFPDASFDYAITEYGACLWCDPYLWIPEAARVLRPGGRLTFLTQSPTLMLAIPDTDDEPASDRMLRDHFGMYRFEWPDDPGVEFHLAHGDWIRLLRANAFEIEDQIDVRAHEGATTRYPWITAEWARRWPVEEVWKARKRG